MANVNWLRTEKRTVRPFVDISTLFDKCEIRCDRNGEFSGDESVVIADVDRDDLEITVRLPSVPPAIAELAKVEKHHLRVIITVNDTRLKKAECLKVYQVDDLIGDPVEYTLTDDEASLFAWYGRVKIEIALVLATDRPLIPGKPFLAGQWLAKKVFSVGVLTENPTFPIQKATSEDFKKRGLPPDTVYYVEFNGYDLNIPYEEMANTVKILIHEDVHNILVKRSANPAAKITETMMGQEIIACVLSAALRDYSFEEPMLDNGVLKSLTDKIHSRIGVNLAQQKQFAEEYGYPKLKAVVQSYTSVKKALLTF